MKIACDSALAGQEWVGKPRGAVLMSVSPPATSLSPHPLYSLIGSTVRLINRKGKRKDPDHE